LGLGSGVESPSLHKLINLKLVSVGLGLSNPSHILAPPLPLFASHAVASYSNAKHDLVIALQWNAWSADMSNKWNVECRPVIVKDFRGCKIFIMLSPVSWIGVEKIYAKKQNIINHCST